MAKREKITISIVSLFFSSQSETFFRLFFQGFGFLSFYTIDRNFDLGINGAIFHPGE